MKAMQKLDEAREKLAEANKDFDNVRRKAKQAKMNFERVKQVDVYFSHIPPFNTSSFSGKIRSFHEVL